MKSGAIRTRRGLVYKPSTTRGHENRLRLCVIPSIGSVTLTAHTRGDVRRLVAEVSADRSPATAGNVRDALRLVLARQVEPEVIPEDVAAGVKAPTADHAPARFLTAEEADRVQAAADAHTAGTLMVPGKDGPRVAPAHPAIGTLVALALATGGRCKPSSGAPADRPRRARGARGRHPRPDRRDPAHQEPP